MANEFLKAEWRKLVMANYSVDSEILKKYLPAGTEFDLWNNSCYLSLVGFMFKNTRIKGFKIPYHINFEEVNLRFYVRRKENDIWKRAVVFIREIVPTPAITFVANALYYEKYITLPMKHEWNQQNGELSVTYYWKKKEWNNLSVRAEDKLFPIIEGSEEEFITEHYWGYTGVNDRKTLEYEVKHPKWEVYPVLDYSINVDFAKVYGEEFAFLKNEKPKSVLLAEGSEISVMGVKKIIIPTK